MAREFLNGVHVNGGTLTNDGPTVLNEHQEIHNANPDYPVLFVQGAAAQVESLLKVQSNAAQTFLDVDALGNVSAGHDALNSDATDGFFHIPGMTNSPTGTPTAVGDTVPACIDTRSDPPVLWAYISGTWRYLVFN